jgi:RNA polymerase sigma factor (sigma-70 family)
MDAAVRDLQTLFDVGVTGTLTDGQLLDRFVRWREGPVFEAIVQRHGPMVWGVCRRVLRDHHDAEDAFQSTFLVLARKAASVRPPEKLGPWLHGVAYQTAMKARATRARRRVREVQVPEMPEPAAVREDHPDDLLSLLDRELGRLPENYRISIVLCELEGMSHREAAERLGWPIGTVSGRLSRAKVMLARRLSRPGVSLSAGSLAVLLARDAASASMPTYLIGATVLAARLFAVGRAVTVGAVSTEVAALTRKVLKAMLLTKLKVITAVLLVGITLAAVGSNLIYRAQVTEPTSQKEYNPQRLLDKQETKEQRTDQRPEKPSGNLWAAISVRWPIERLDEARGVPITVYFALVNDGDKTVVPKIKSSKLFINGKIYEDWPRIVSDVGLPVGSRRARRFHTLAPGEDILFGYGLKEAFSQPGIYRVRWEGEGFQSPEIMFRVMLTKEEDHLP